ncbi:MAG: hypothetical protein L0177_19300 [Chloroflexi bacterium]|nr:hypothetical protein [Chloroflexota bacterium]
MLTPRELHRCMRESLRPFGDERLANGLRALLEQGGAETFLRDLLFIRLCAEGQSVSREFPLGNRCASDLVVHGESELHIEVKQLHLKDGCKYAVNLVNDLGRYQPGVGCGVLFIADERSSTATVAYSRYGGANRRAAHDVDAVLAELPTHFTSVYPRTAVEARLREFPEAGGLSLYGFVVACGAPAA